MHLIIWYRSIIWLSWVIRFLNYEKYENLLNFEQFFDDVISGHNDIIGCWFFTAWKVLGLGLIILKVWGYLTYRYYVTFSESDPSFRFSQMKKSRKMNLFDRFNPCFRVNRYRWIRWWYQIFDILNFGTFRFIKLKGPNMAAPNQLWFKHLSHVSLTSRPRVSLLSVSI